MKEEKTVRVYFCAYPMENMIMNFGDHLTLPILNHFKPAGVRFIPSKESECRMVAVGSILHSYPVRKKIVWGTGALNEDLCRDFPLDRHRIYALRGEKTKACIGLNKGGIQQECNVALGDPGILVSEVYPRGGNRNGKIGVIPHYFDAESDQLERFRCDSDYLLIDVCRSPEEVVRDIAACKAIVSSSLHGLIVADSYGIPNRWLKISLEQDFKFYDYFSSVARNDESSVPVSAEEVDDSIFFPITYGDMIQRSKKDLVRALTKLFEDIQRNELPFDVEDKSMDICQMPMTMFIEGCKYFNRNKFLKSIKRFVSRIIRKNKR